MRFCLSTFYFLFSITICPTFQINLEPPVQAQEGELPYHLVLEVRIGGQWHYNGSAILVSEYEAVTSAQQVYSNLETRETIPAESLRVIGGAIDLYNKSRMQIKKISKIIVHPTFGKYMQHLKYIPTVIKFWVDDLAILTFTAEIRFNRLVQPVIINFDPEKVIHGFDCVRSGWTLTVNESSNATMKINQNLMKETVNLRSRHEMNYFITNDTELYKKTHRVMIGDKKRKSCIQELGGPLVCEVWGQKLLIGISMNYVEKFMCSITVFNYFLNLASLDPFLKQNLMEYSTSGEESQSACSLLYAVVTATFNYFILPQLYL